jgi:nucleoside-diphosphate-sugar epimerase
MTLLPPIASEAALEAELARPSPELIADLRATAGDVLVLGVGGKMGPSLARLARRALDEAGQSARRVIGVARFSAPGLREALQADGVETIAADLLAPGALEALPDAPNVIYMVAQKFSSTDDAPLLWAMNTYLPGRVAERFAGARIVCFSSGNVYPFSEVARGGSVEEDALGPLGEYAHSVVGRERMFQHFSAVHGTPGVLLRLNYAVELRYGVLLDLAQKVAAGEPVDVTMGHVNVIWQGDANAVALRALACCAAPPWLLNVTGLETLSVRDLAGRLAALLGLPAPRIVGKEAPTSLLSNAARCRERFGPPRVGVEQVLAWVAHWVRHGGRVLDKPTKFQVRDGRF